MSWTPVFVLPNLALNDVLEGKHIALVPPDDHRVAQFAAQQQVFGKFMTSFTDAFGVRLQPAVLLIRDGAPKGTDTAEAVAGFRDIVVSCTVPVARARWMTAGTSFRGAHYSDAFDFHAWSVGRDNRHLVSSTMAQMAMHRVDKFKGQSDPHLGISTLGSFDVDEPLFHALLERWGARFHSRRPEREDVALFRSLGMANQAMKVAGGVAVQIYDIGRLTSLWTSAFETLMHPGQNGQVNERSVRQRLMAITWQRADLRAKRYQLSAGAAPVKERGVPVRVSLPGLIYFQLSDARNAFTHGKDVSSRALFMRPNGQSLGNLAALLYRMALSDHVDLVWKQPMPPMSDIEEWGKWYGRHSDFMTAQHVIEDAISIARITPDRDGDGRAAVKAKIRAKYKRPRKAISPPPRKP